MAFEDGFAKNKGYLWSSSYNLHLFVPNIFRISEIFISIGEDLGTIPLIFVNEI